MSATTTRTNYNVTITREFKQRLLRLPVEIHRSLANPMREHLEKLVTAAEKKAAKNGKG